MRPPVISVHPVQREEEERGEKKQVSLRPMF
jgi:hypothetical protein